MVFEVEHHADMLSDTIRLDLYHEAINGSVGSKDIVVDIGTGTGILASYAASITDNTVYAIEYFSQTAAVAERMFVSNDVHNVVVVNSASYDFTETVKPDIVITETIGRLGPEENIVEILYEFCQRYPSVRQTIPANLKVMAVPVKSVKLSDMIREQWESLLSASYDGFDYSKIERLVRLSNAQRSIVTRDEFDAEPIGDPVCVAVYQLGQTASSDFSNTLTFDTSADANGVHLYFEAELSDGVVLSSHLDAPLTHWGRTFLPKPQAANELGISYDSKTKNFNFSWKETDNE